MRARLMFGAVAFATLAAAAIVAFGGDAGDPTAGQDAQRSGEQNGTLEPSDSQPAGPAAPAGEFALLDGGQSSFVDLEGAPVVVNFFADWCPACVAELPDFQAIHEEFGDAVTFLGMDRSTSLDGARALLAEAGVTYTIAVDDGTFFQQFEGFAMPTTVFINERGEIVDRQNGAIFESDLRERVEDLLAG